MGPLRILATKQFLVTIDIPPPPQKKLTKHVPLNTPLWHNNQGLAFRSCLLLSQ